MQPCTRVVRSLGRAIAIDVRERGLRTWRQIVLDCRIMARSGREPARRKATMAKGEEKKKTNNKAKLTVKEKKAKKKEKLAKKG